MIKPYKQLSYMHQKTGSDYNNEAKCLFHLSIHLKIGKQ